MTDCDNDFASLIPETPKRERVVPSEAMANPANREGMRHYALTLHNIGSGVFESWTTIDADAVRIISPVAVLVEIASVGVVQDEAFLVPYTGAPAPQGTFAPILQPGVGGVQVAGALPAFLMPAGDWLIDRPVSMIRFPQQVRPEVNSNWRSHDFPNAVIHLFVMRGNTRNAGFGRPIPHSVSIGIGQQPGAAWFSDPIRPTISGDDTGIPLTCGMIPTRSEITGFSWNFSFAGAGSGVISVTVYHIRAGGFHTMGSFYPPILPVGDHELSIPMEFSPLQCRKSEFLDDRGALRLFVGTNAIIEGGNFNLRMRSYM